VTLHVSGSVDVVWSSLNDATYGDFTSMNNGTLGALTLTFTHPGTGGDSVAMTLPPVVLSKDKNDIKMTDVVLSSLNFEATKSLTSGYTIQSTVANGVYLPY